MFAKLYTTNLVNCVITEVTFKNNDFVENKIPHKA